MIPFVFSFTTSPRGFMQNVLTRSSNFSVLYTILLSYNSSVRRENISAGSSTRTPISTRFDFVSMFKSLQTLSIHLLPLRPTEIIHCLPRYFSFSVIISYPSSSACTCTALQLNTNSTLSFNSSNRL